MIITTPSSSILLFSFLDVLVSFFTSFVYLLTIISTLSLFPLLIPHALRQFLYFLCLPSHNHFNFESFSSSHSTCTTFLSALISFFLFLLSAFKTLQCLKYTSFLFHQTLITIHCHYYHCNSHNHFKPVDLLIQEFFHYWHCC